MAISSDLLDKINQYLDNQITISELEEWLVPREPFLLREPESDDSDIIGAIELGLAEMSAGLRVEDDLRRLFREALEGKPSTIWVGDQVTKAFFVTGSSSINMKPVFTSSFSFSITQQQV
jgi:hypothetical protein